MAKMSRNQKRSALSAKISVAALAALTVLLTIHPLAAEGAGLEQAKTGSTADHKQFESLDKKF